MQTFGKGNTIMYNQVNFLGTTVRGHFVLLYVGLNQYIECKILDLLLKSLPRDNQYYYAIE
jgi:hypothetical protein